VGLAALQVITQTYMHVNSYCCPVRYLLRLEAYFYVLPLYTGTRSGFDMVGLMWSLQYFDKSEQLVELLLLDSVRVESDRDPRETATTEDPTQFWSQSWI